MIKQIHSIVWSPDGRWLATCGHSNQIQIWDFRQGTVVKTLQANKAPVRSICWSSDNKLFACGQGNWKSCETGHVQVWRVSDGELAWLSQDDLFGTYAVSFSPDSHWLASGHGSGVTNIWQAGTGQKLLTTTIKDDIRNLINGIGFSVDNMEIACGTCYENAMYIYSLYGDIKHELFFPQQNSWVDFEHPIKFSPDNRWLARGSQCGHVNLWRKENLSSPIEITGDKAPIYAISWHPTGAFLAGGSRHGRIAIWDMTTQKDICWMRHRPLHTVRYSPDGRFLASGGDNDAIYIWDVDTASDTFGQRVKVLVAVS